VIALAFELQAVRLRENRANLVLVEITDLSDGCLFGGYGDEEYGDVALCLLCQMHGQFTNGSMVKIDINLEDLGAPQIWRPLNCTDDDGHLLLPDSATEVEQVAQEVRRQVGLLLLRLEELIQQARVKQTPTPTQQRISLRDAEEDAKNDR